MKTHFALIAALTLLPAVAGAQAIRCQDPVSGKILYTDQPCPSGSAEKPLEGSLTVLPPQK